MSGSMNEQALYICEWQGFGLRLVCECWGQESGSGRGGKCYVWHAAEAPQGYRSNPLPHCITLT